MKSKLHELHGKVCVKMLYLLELLGRCGCCQEQDLTRRYCPDALLLTRERTLPKPSCLQGWLLCYARSNRLCLQSWFRLQWSSAGLPSRYTQTAPISTLAYLITGFATLVPPFLCHNLLPTSLSYFFPIGPSFATSLSKSDISVTIT